MDPFDECVEGNWFSGIDQQRGQGRAFAGWAPTLVPLPVDA
jgi:hypothetical protein